MASKKLGVNNRKAIFLKLVELQDSGMSVRDSKNQIQESFGIEDDELQAIEDEGLENQWPPLAAVESTKFRPDYGSKMCVPWLIGWPRKNPIAL